MLIKETPTYTLNLKREANIQIDIMRQIAINGKLTKPELVTKTNSSYNTINTTLIRDSKKGLIQSLFIKSGSIHRNGKDQPYYVLTGFGINVLLRSHYKKNNENDKNKKSGKPLLNVDEFQLFLTNFKSEKKYETVDDFSWIYISFNPQLTDIIKEKFKNEKNNLNKILKQELKIKNYQKKINEIDANKSHEEHELKLLLAKLLIK
jgi:hypothetical protein